jgi:hypothetical protein
MGHDAPSDKTSATPAQTMRSANAVNTMCANRELWVECDASTIRHRKLPGRNGVAPPRGLHAAMKAHNAARAVIDQPMSQKPIAPSTFKYCRS